MVWMNTTQKKIFKQEQKSQNRDIPPPSSGATWLRILTIIRCVHRINLTEMYMPIPNMVAEFSMNFLTGNEI